MNQVTKIQPLQAIVLSFCFPLAFLALVADLAYLATYELQWKNFASWSVPLPSTIMWNCPSSQ